MRKRSITTHTSGIGPHSEIPDLVLIVLMVGLVVLFGRRVFLGGAFPNFSAYRTLLYYCSGLEELQDRNHGRTDTRRRRPTVRKSVKTGDFDLWTDVHLAVNLDTRRLKTALETHFIALYNLFPSVEHVPPAGWRFRAAHKTEQLVPVRNKYTERPNHCAVRLPPGPRCLLRENVSSHQWFSGRIQHCHCCDPGSIPG